MLFLPHLFSGFSVGFCEANENAVITCATRIQEWTEWALSGGLFFPAEAMCVVGCVLIRHSLQQTIFMGVISLAEQERHATPRGGMNNDSRWGGSSMSWNSDAFHTCSDGHLA
eukprot:scaffold263620_cov22-Tisochrysis_lutea.AAC.1